MISENKFIFNFAVNRLKFVRERLNEPMNF